MKSLTFALAIIFLGVAVATAQTAGTPTNQNSATTQQPSVRLGTPVAKPTNSLLSLFDPSRFRITQSYTMSYLSGSGQGRMVGMYLNQIDYQFAQPLRLSVSLGILHQPQGLVGASVGQRVGSQFLPSFRLYWEPSRNFHFMVGYETRSPYQMNNYDYYDRFWRDESSTRLRR